MRVLWLRLCIALLDLSIEYQRHTMYIHARRLAEAQGRARSLRASLASIDCPRRALRVVIAQKGLAPGGHSIAGKPVDLYKE